MAAYTEIIRITREHNGIPINLLLQTRNDNPPEPYHCLSWRTRYPSGKSNRRFYRTKGDGCWTIPVSVALSMLREAEETGMLDERYDDPQIRHTGTANKIIDSRTFSASERRGEFDNIVDEDGEPDWGSDPIFIIIQMPDRAWRKIMIVDTEREFCTFRSTTIDSSYNLKITLPQTEWYIDNAMQDASAAILREFLSVLREL